jgi:membrane protease YdiL (CAAX protease family)
MIACYYVLLAGAFLATKWTFELLGQAYGLDFLYVFSYVQFFFWFSALAIFVPSSLTRPSVIELKSSWRRAASWLGAVTLLIVAVGLYLRFDHDSLSRSVTERLVITLILAPVFEELFFRRYLFNRMLSTHSLNWAIVLNGLLFTVVHLEYSSLPDYRSICTWFGGGMAFCIVYAYAGYRACVVAHVLGNSVHIFLHGA